MRRRHILTQCALLGALLVLPVKASTTALESKAEESSRPALLGPPPNSKLTFRNPARASISFTWRAVTGVRTYRVVIAKSRRLEEPVFEKTTAELFVVVEGLPEGRYFWQVEAIHEDGIAPAASQLAAFSIVGRR